MTPEQAETIANALEAGRTHAIELRLSLQRPYRGEHLEIEADIALIERAQAIDIANILARLERAEEALARHENFGKQALDFYYETNCACASAERYVATCPKHGTRSADRKDDHAKG